jgi:hypothetical protein
VLRGRAVRREVLRLGGGRRLDVDVVDLLRVDEGTRGLVRRQLVEILEENFRCARHAEGGEAGARGWITAYVEECTDPGVYGLYNVAVVFRDAGKPIGVLHGSSRLREFEGERIELVRGSINVLTAYRGHKLVNSGLYRLVRAYVRDRLIVWHPRYYQGAMVSPAAYRVVHRRALSVYPSPTRVTSARLRRLYEFLYPGTAAQGGLTVEQIGTRVDARTAAWLRESRDPIIRYYLERNPRFEEGFGLPVLMRLGLIDLLYTLGVSAVLGAQRRLRRALKGRRRDG